jgi:hypothetical protein
MLDPRSGKTHQTATGEKRKKVIIALKHRLKFYWPLGAKLTPLGDTPLASKPVELN